VGGAPGTGKTTVAGGLGAALGWIVLGSDETRKELAGVPTVQAVPSDYGTGLYTPEMSERVYGTLLERAGSALERGHTVVLDATWAARRWREEAAEVASRTSSDLLAFECRAPGPVAAGRIRQRLAGPAQPSDATPEVAARVAGTFDPWPTAHVVDTSGDPDAVLARIVADVAGSPSPPDVRKRDFWP